MAARGASSGGYARALSLTSEERSAIARRAAQTRWGRQYEDGTFQPNRLHRQKGSDECNDLDCPCHELRKDPLGQCVLKKPLFMVIPPGGTHLPCPIHGQHFVMGSRLS